MFEQGRIGFERGNNAQEPPVAHFDYASSNIESENVRARLSQRILGTKLGKFAAVALCSVALGGIFSTESAAKDAYPSVAKSQPITHTEKDIFGLNKAIIPACPNPPYYVSIPVQLEAFDCLMIQAQESSSDTPPMTLYEPLNQSALLKTQDVIDCGWTHEACGRRFAYHIPKQDENGRLFNCWGENLAKGPRGAGSVQSRFYALMASPDHRENIVNPYWDFYGRNMIRIGNENYLTTHFASYNRCGS